MTESAFRTNHWPTIQGRGEFPRLVVEDTGADCLDVARLHEADGRGVPALLNVLDRMAGFEAAGRRRVSVA